MVLTTKAVCCGTELGRTFCRTSCSHTFQVSCHAGLCVRAHLFSVPCTQFSPCVPPPRSSGLTAFWESLRYYFDVHNRFVLHKLKALLVPYTHKKWGRIKADRKWTVGSWIADAHTHTHATIVTYSIVFVCLGVCVCGAGSASKLPRTFSVRESCTFAASVCLYTDTTTPLPPPPPAWLCVCPTMRG